MMTVEQNIREILKCYFTGFKDEIIDSAVERILDIKHPNLIITQDGDIKEIHDCEKCEMRKAWERVGMSLSDKIFKFLENENENEKMTNREKFEEIFGFSPEDESCPASMRTCAILHTNCVDCLYWNWWNKEYKPCFKLREDLK